MIKAKKATAFALILAMMASFAACSKIDNEAVSKKVESFAKAAANLDADGMCKIADGLDDDDQEMIEEELSMGDMDSDEKTVKKAIASTIKYEVDSDSIAEGKKEGTVTCNVIFSIADYDSVLTDDNIKTAEEIASAVKSCKDMKKYKVECTLTLKKEKYYVTKKTIENLADLYSFLDAEIKFGPDSNDIIGMIDHTKWYASNDGYYTNVDKIELDLYFNNNPEVDYYYKVLKDGSEVYTSSPAHTTEYFAEAVYGAEQNAAMDNNFLAEGSYEIQFYLASDNTFLTSSTTFVSAPKATPTPEPSSFQPKTDCYEFYNTSFAKIKEVQWFEYDEDEGTKVKDGVYYGDVKNLAFSIEVYEPAGEIYYAYYYAGTDGNADIDYSKPDFSDTIKTSSYDDGHIYYDIDYTPSEMKPGIYRVVIAANKDSINDPYAIALCNVLEQKSSDI